MTIKQRLAKAEKRVRPAGPGPMTIEIIAIGMDRQPTGEMVRMTPGPDGITHEYFVDGQQVPIERFMRITCEGGTVFELPDNGRGDMVAPHG